jgi:D-alanyl-D-alanine carboxypeptidase
MDWQKILDAVKRFFLALWEVIKYYVPFLISKIWEGLKFLGRKLKKLWKKLKKWFKRYIRLLVKHTKKGDYSILIYSALAVVAFILVIVLIGHAVGGARKSKKSTSTETETEVVTTEDPAVAAQNQLISQANAIYQNYSALLVLVNAEHTLDESYSFEHHTLNSGKDIDARALDDLRNMLNACNEAGNEYNIISGYRDRDSQQALVDEEVANIVAAEGLSQEEATTKAYQTVQPAGCSEHETGLALDITDVNTYTLDDYVAEDATNQWLINNSYLYGFVLRYPTDKVAYTGIDFEPWHFRYVGVEAATFMHDNNLCLEEFYNLIGQ